MIIKVFYTDGNSETFGTVGEAEAGIRETVTGCDFAATVDEVYQEVEGKRSPLFCNWSLMLMNT